MGGSSCRLPHWETFRDSHSPRPLGVSIQIQPPSLSDLPLGARGWTDSRAQPVLSPPADPPPPSVPRSSTCQVKDFSLPDTQPSQLTSFWPRWAEGSSGQTICLAGWLAGWLLRVHVRVEIVHSVGALPNLPPTARQAPSTCSSC
jgi:hypothetical protein